MLRDAVLGVMKESKGKQPKNGGTPGAAPGQSQKKVGTSQPLQTKCKGKGTGKPKMPNTAKDLKQGKSKDKGKCEGKGKNLKLPKGKGKGKSGKGGRGKSTGRGKGKSTGKGSR